jgi:hypothetical protein
MGSKEHLLSLCTAVAIASFARGAYADTPSADDTMLGAEFVDTPANYVAAKPKLDESKRPSYVPGYLETPAIGLSPFSPQQPFSIPGGLTPAYGHALSGTDWKFKFSGYLQQPIVAGFGERSVYDPKTRVRTQGAYTGQKETTIHGEPVVPGASYGWFDHTNTVPGPWAQLNFEYGNKTVKAHTVIGAWTIGQAQNSAGYFQPPSMLWFDQAFITYTPNVDPVKLMVRVGAYNDSYGGMARWDNGAYGVPFIGQMRGVGTTATLTLPFENEVTFQLEGGVKGHLNKSPLGLTQDGSNAWPVAATGSTWGAHGHLSAGYAGVAQASLHYMHTWSQDDRIDNAAPADPKQDVLPHKDGRISLMGVDARVDAERFGFLYVGAFRVTGRNALSVANLMQVLYTGGGKDFADRYWGFGSQGNGALSVVGAQYTMSLGTLLRYPMEFWGDGPDIRISVFGMYGRATSAQADFDKKSMLKGGLEGTYSLFSWLAASLRMDQVAPDLDDSARSFFAISPKLIFRTNWQTREALTVQYARYFVGGRTRVEGDARLHNTPQGVPDKHLVAIYGTMWW